ncbi:MAG: hypothetical protein K0Q56_1128 [Sporolactobacillus laevolacticus]|jgi:hypothetical protein|nr:hypothetical protein [Sporolactobacillus laevolacticus]
MNEKYAKQWSKFQKLMNGADENKIFSILGNKKITYKKLKKMY